MRTFISLLTLVLISLGSNAQGGKDYNVMVIPFDPAMYFSDSDQMLAQYNRKSIPEVRKQFRYGLNANLSAQILSSHGSRSMLQDTTQDVQEDLYTIYKNITYFGDKSTGPQILAPGEKTANKGGGVASLFKKKNDKAQQNNTNALMPEKHEAQDYINVKIHSKEMMTYLSEKYNTDVFLFINQFNLVTNYEHCLDRANNVFEREVLVHYSVFDANGNQLSGDVARVHFPSNSNNIAEIMKANFPELSKNIYASLPSSSKVGEPADAEPNHAIKD